MWIAVQIQVPKVAQRLGGSCFVDLPAQDVASQDLRDLKIDQMGSVQCLLRRADALSDAAARVRDQQEF